MKKGYLLLGHDVTKEIYEKYNNEKYPFMGRPVSLDGIYIWATDDEIAKQFPKWAAEAKTIIATIEKEITGMKKTQQKNTFHSFLEKLMNAYKEELNTYESVHGAFNIAQREWDAMQTDKNAPEYVKLIARGEFEKARVHRDEHKTDAYKGFCQKAKHIRKEMEDFAVDFFRADPSKIDQRAMQLVDSGILSADEVEHMAMQYRDNPTMLRLLSRHAAKRADEAFALNGNKVTHESGKWRILANSLDVSDASVAMGGFDQLAEHLKTALDWTSYNGYVRAETRQKTADMIYSSIVKNYDNYLIQPDGGEMSEKRLADEESRIQKALTESVENAHAENYSSNIVYVQE